MAVQRDRSEELYQLFDGLLPVAMTGGIGFDGKFADLSAGIAPRAGHRPDGAISLQSSSEVQTFNRFAQAFSQEIASVSEHIMNLTRLTQRQNVFDDQSPEISGMTQMVKTSLQRLHNDLSTLDDLKRQAIAAQRSAVSRSSHGAGRSDPSSLWGGSSNTESQLQASTKHSDTVVDSLRAKLARSGQQFRSVLQQQTRVMKDNATRRDMFTADRPQTFESALFRDQENQQLQQQQLLSNNNTQYYRQRAEAVRELEAAVAEVGELFHDFTRLVHEQDELIVRIDNDVDDALVHVNAGSNELMRYLANISSNRGLIMKIFGVLFFFLLFFGFVVVR